MTADGGYSFSRNVAGQITAVSGVGNCVYDGNGKRIKTEIDGQIEYAIYDRTGTLKQLYNASSGSRTDLLQVQGKTVVQIKNQGGVDSRTYLAVDLLGSPVNFAGDDGYTDHKERYGPYGDKLNDIDTAVGYTGHQHDRETGLTYAQARYYDAAVGRFLSADPIDFTGAPPTVNRYGYANNNPYRYTDPTGETAILVAPAVVEAIVITGAVIAATPLVIDALAGAITQASDALSDAMTAALNENANGDGGTVPGAVDLSDDLAGQEVIGEIEGGEGKILEGMDDKKFDPTTGTHDKVAKSREHPD